MVLLSVLVVGMRWKLPPVLDAVRRMNRTLTNPTGDAHGGLGGHPDVGHPAHGQNQWADV